MPAYIKIPDIDGEVNEQNHEKWIEINSVSESIFRSIAQGAKGAQRSNGETSLGDVVVVKQWDCSTSLLMSAVANGVYKDEVLIHLCSTINDENCVNLEIKLKDVILSGHNFHATCDQSPTPTEEISMNYTKIEWLYKKFDEMGKDAGNFPAKYDTEKAKS